MLKLGSSRVDELDRASAWLHPRAQLLDAPERSKGARCIVPRGQMIAQEVALIADASNQEIDRSNR